ncbi:MAG: hypothetical protein HFI40_03300 [Lachnospiraceae bacterium]|jgi:hypothetical protein|nr:hypothetical protein [Lachnospiraceae bacterium]
MKKQSKCYQRALALCLALVLSLSALSGCNKGKKDTTQENNSKTEGNQENPEAGKIDNDGQTEEQIETWS